MSLHANPTNDAAMAETGLSDGGINNRILVVEDDPEGRFGLKDYLTNYGFRVSTAGNGEFMELRMNTADYDLVILARSLPGEDGLALTSKILQTWRTPIIIISSVSSTEDRIFALESGAADYVTKPFEPRELVARVRAVLRRTGSTASNPARREPEAVEARPPPRVIGPSGKPMTVEDLPPADTQRWVRRRKAEVVAAVRGGLITKEDALGRYNLTPEELQSWQRALEGRKGNGNLIAFPKRRRAMGKLLIDLGGQSVEVDGHHLHLSPQEFAVLEVLFSRRGKTFTKAEILGHLYGEGGQAGSKIVDVLVCMLRQKLTAASDGDDYIATTRGQGYKLRDPATLDSLDGSSAPGQ